jgi:hypothetical protein
MSDPQPPNIERQIIEAMETRLDDAGYNVQFGRVIDPNKIEDEELPVLSMQLGSGGVGRDLSRPRLRNTMNLELLLWVELVDNDRPIVECIEHLGDLIRDTYTPAEDGIDSLIGANAYLTIESGNVDIQMQQTGYALITLSVQVTYIR